MKILHVLRSADPRQGGPIEGVRLLGLENVRDQVEVEVLCLDDPQAPWVRNFHLPLHALGPVATKYGFRLRLPAWLGQNLPKYDAVIVNGLWQFHGLAVWRALHRSTLPYFVFPHGMLDPWFKQAYPLKHLKKWCYWPWAEYRVLRDARSVFFTSHEERRLARQSFWLYRCREIVLGYGTRPPSGDPAQQQAAFLQRFPECAGKRLWLFLGRIHVKKGCDLLLEAFAQIASRHPALHLVIAGPDPTGWQTQLQERVRHLALAPRVSWTGMLGADLKWGALRAAEVLLLPSHQENFGLVVAEALACGLPVLISNRVNIWREILQTGAGLIEPDDLAGTRRLAERWLALSDQDKTNMREQAVGCFRKHFAIEVVARRFRAHLWEHVSRSSPSLTHAPATGSIVNPVPAHD